MPTVIDDTPCRYCGKPREPHDFDKERFKKHYYELPDEYRNDVLMECARKNCGSVFLADGYRTDAFTLGQKLRGDGWKMIDGKWKCSRCAMKTTATKLAKENQRNMRELSMDDALGKLLR